MGTQKECVELFAVNEKQLSKLIMGRYYQGGKDQLTHKCKVPDESWHEGEEGHPSGPG